MKRVIRLTERDLSNLIKKIVRESMEDEKEMIDTDFDYSEEDYSDEDYSDEENDFGKMSKEDAIQKIADFLSSEVLPELSPRELSMLKRKTKDVESPMDQMNENEDEEEFNDLDSRRASRREKGMIRGGLATAGASAVALLGEFMGYSEFEMTNMLHDINHMAGLGRYTGPVGVGLVALGLAAALKGLDMRMRRTGK